MVGSAWWVLSLFRSVTGHLFFLQYFDAVSWVFWPVKPSPRSIVYSIVGIYIVLVETLNPAQSNQYHILMQCPKTKCTKPHRQFPEPHWFTSHKKGIYTAQATQRTLRLTHKKKLTRNRNSQQFWCSLRAAAFSCTSACLHRNIPLVLSPAHSHQFSEWW